MGYVVSTSARISTLQNISVARRRESGAVVLQSQAETFVMFSSLFLGCCTLQASDGGQPRSNSTNFDKRLSVSAADGGPVICAITEDRNNVSKCDDLQDKEREKRLGLGQEPLF